MNKNYKEIDVLTMFRSLLGKWWLILILMLIGGGLAYIRAAFFLDPLYESETVIFVGKDNSAFEFDYGNVKIGGKLIADYRELVETRQVLEGTIAHLGLNVSPKDLKKLVHVHSEEGVRFMKITVEYEDPELAAAIANRLSYILIEKVNEIIGIDNIYIIDEAVVNDESVYPSVYRDTFVGLVVGGIAACYVIFLRYIVLFRVADISMLEKHIGKSVLGEVTHSSKVNSHDQYDNILSKISHDDRVILVSSTHYSEGKSTVIMNMARSYSRFQKNTLIIDADLRKPMISDLFKMSRSNGLSDVLRGRRTVEQVIKHESQFLDIMTTGFIPSDPSEFLNHDVFKKVLEDVSYYDVIIIDIPPLQTYSDGLQLVELADFVIFCVEKNKTRIEGIKDCIKKIETVGCKSLGLLMTRKRR